MYNSMALLTKVNLQSVPILFFACSQYPIDIFKTKNPFIL
jgi:hypothetical protein